MRTVRIGLIWLACVLVSIPMWPQSSTTSVSGTVQDSSGAVVTGADITLNNKSNGFDETMQSDTKGL